MKSPNPNPAGREGKPISFYPHTLDEIVDKMLKTPPPPKEAKALKKITNRTAEKR